MADPVSVISEFFTRDMTKSYSIISCEVCRDFRGDDDVVGSKCVVSGGERDLDEFCSEIGECFFSFFYDFTGTWFDTITEVFFWETDFYSLQICAIPYIRRDFDSSVERCRIERIVTLHSIPDEVCIADCTRAYPHRIER
jgi:hypothetical protein